MAETYGRFTPHPAAALFPLLTGKALDEFVADVDEHGQRNACVIWRGQLLDGRNRWIACARLGIEPRVRELQQHLYLNGVHVRAEDIDEAFVWKWVFSENLRGRRHLTESQRAMLGAEFARALRANWRTGDGRVADAAAELVNVGSRSVQRAEKVLEDGTPELVDQVRAGDVKVGAAAEVAKLPAEEQAATVADGPAAVRAKAKSVRENTRQALHSSETNEHYTPVQYIEAARTVMGSITLDPASCEKANTIVRAEDYLTAKDDGLTCRWWTDDADGMPEAARVWLNPPYGKDGNESNQARWLSKLHVEVADGRVEQACVLVNAATGAGWFQDVWRCDAVCFVRGRIEFLDSETLEPQKSPTHYSVIGYVGPNVEAFVREFAMFGRVVPGQLVADWQAGVLAGDQGDVLGGAA